MGLRPLDHRGTDEPATSTAPSTSTSILHPAAGRPPRRRGVLGGLVVFAVGFSFLLPALGIPNAGPFLFIAIGSAFGAAYMLGYRQYVYLVPAATMLGLGIGLLIPAVFDVGLLGAPIFFGALAAALVSVTLLAPDRRWPIVPAAPLALIAIAGVIGRIDLVPGFLQPFILPVVLMLVGGYLLFEPTNR
jgi:hypothetical protein